MIIYLMSCFDSLKPHINKMLPYFESSDHVSSDYVRDREELVAAINTYPSLASLEGRQLLGEEAMCRPDLSALGIASWLGERCYNADVTTALAGLERLVETQHFEILCYVALVGLKLPSAVDLTNTIKLLPPSEFPEHTRYLFEEHPSADAALVKSLVITSPLSASELGKLAKQAKGELMHCAYALTLAHPDAFAPLPTRCIIAPAKDYPGSSSPVQGFLDPDEGVVLLGSRSRWPDERLEELREILSVFLSLPPETRLHYEVGLQRYADAKRRGGHYTSILNAALDLGIALESLFIAGDSRSDITYRLRLRIAKLLGNDVDERIKVSERVNKLYSLRSTIVHGARLKPKETRQQAFQKVWKSATKNRYPQLVRDAIVALIMAEAREEVCVGNEHSWKRFELS
jgi:hypothetical protein